MKPAWDKLANKYKGSKEAFVGDVDCTAEGQSLCQHLNIRGYPKLKYGESFHMEEYEGERDYESLKKFAKDVLKPKCGPENLDLCEEKDKEKLEKYMGMEAEDLDYVVKKQEDMIQKEEDDFTAFSDQLQEEFKKAEEKEKKNVDQVKRSGLNMMLAVQKHKAPPKEASKSETPEKVEHATCSGEGEGEGGTCSKGE